MSLVTRAKQLGVDLWRSRRGNIAMMTAFLTPVLLLSTFGGISVMEALSRKQELADVAQLVCNRAIKPTRMKILTDSDRQAHAQANFDSLAADHKFTIISRNVTTGWLTAEVKASAMIPAISRFSSADVPSFPVSVDVTCAGLPPFPAIGDVILTSDFEKPDGEDLPFKYGNWGVYQPSEFGWEGGSGPGVEIQKLGPGGLQAIPPGSNSIYAVELDSDTQGSGIEANSSMYKTVELHRGTYRFSFLYLGRMDNPATNTISVYLEGERPVSPKVQKLSVSRPYSDGWHLESFDIPVATYSLYRLTIAAEGISDSVGGLFNNLKLEYIQGPSSVPMVATQ